LQEVLFQAQLCHLKPPERRVQVGLALFFFLFGELFPRVLVGDQHELRALDETHQQDSLVLAVHHGLLALVHFAPTSPQVALLIKERHGFYGHLHWFLLGTQQSP
jgi:hypothetical protein